MLDKNADNYLIYIYINVAGELSLKRLENLGISLPENLKKSLETGIKNIYPIEFRNKKISVDNIVFGKPKYDPDNWNDIKEAILKKDTIGLPYSVKFNLKNKETGETISEKSINVGVMPVNTKLNAFIVDGNSYNIPLQFRLKPGAYSRINDRGQAEIFNNVENGLPFRTQISPKRGTISMNIKQGTVPMIPIIKSLGITDKTIKKTIGQDLFNKNIGANYERSLKKLHKALYNKDAEDMYETEAGVLEYFNKTKTTPEINKKTIGNSHEKITGQYLLDTVSKLIAVTRGDKDPDNRDSLEYKKVLGPADLLQDQLSRAGKRGLFFKTRFKLATKDDIDDIINKKELKKHIDQFFTSSKISRYADQTNPISMYSGGMLTTLLGEGGVGGAELITDDAKRLQNTHMGFLDPVHTPEASTSGISLNLAMDTKKEGSTLKTKVINVVTGKTEWINFDDLKNLVLAFPGEFEQHKGKWIPKKNKTAGIVNDERVEVPSGMIKYMVANPSGMFGITSNTVPFMQSNQGNRLLTGAKMSIQGIALDKPEMPLVEPYINGTPILDTIGESFSIRANEPGTVKKITDNYIDIKTKSGVKKYFVPKNIPLNDKAFIDAKIRVKVGDKVKKGQIISDTNFTEDGKFVNGVNLVTAYLPWKGFNHEDSSVITESAARKLTSVHIHKKILPLKSNVINDLAKYKAYRPYSIDKLTSANYDDDGVIKPGTKLKKHDIIAASLVKNEVTGADALIARLKKSAVEPYKDNSLEWNRDVEGEVVDVVKDRKHVTVYVKTKEPMKLSDKISGRHGNKTTVGLIIPDELAPTTKDGKKIELILDPLSVPSRINIGQLLETAAAKVADKMGKTYQVENFSGKDERQNILDLMKKYKIPEKEDIFDPETGKTIPNVFTGLQYFQKLKHQVDLKTSARGTSEPYSKDNQPIAGGGHGGMSLDNLTSNVLLAHGARDFMRDGFAIKNNPNSEYWRAIQNSDIPPAPQTLYEWNKFTSLMRGMGINTVKKGSSISLAPLTDKDVKDISAGAIKNPTRTYIGKGKNLTPDKHGLFGEITGGLRGDLFNHIELTDRIINPSGKEAVKSLLHLTEKEFEKQLRENKSG